MTNLNLETVHFIIDEAHEFQMLGTPLLADYLGKGLERSGDARD